MPSLGTLAAAATPKGAYLPNTSPREQSSPEKKLAMATTAFLAREEWAYSLSLPRISRRLEPSTENTSNLNYGNWINRSYAANIQIIPERISTFCRCMF